MEKITKEQSVMLQGIWGELEDRLARYLGKDRVVTPNELGQIANDTLKIFYELGCTQEEATLAFQFVQFSIDTLLQTASLEETTKIVVDKYKFNTIDMIEVISKKIFGQG